MTAATLLAGTAADAAPTPPPHAAPRAPAPSAPPAPKRRMVALLDIRVEGASEDVERQFEHDLEQQLDTNAYWLATRAKVAERMTFSTRWTTGCLVGTCLTEVRTQTSAELVLLVAITGSGTSFGYVVTLVRTDNGRALSQESARCDVCTAKETTRAATLATMNLLNAVPDVLPDEGAQHAAELDLAVGTLKRQLAAERHAWRNRGIGLLVTGVVLAAAGATAYVVTDESPYGLATAATGAGLAIGGLAVLAF